MYDVPFLMGGIVCWWEHTQISLTLLLFLFPPPGSLHDPSADIDKHRNRST